MQISENILIKEGTRKIMEKQIKIKGDIIRIKIEDKRKVVKVLMIKEDALKKEGTLADNIKIEMIKGLAKIIKEVEPSMIKEGMNRTEECKMMKKLEKMKKEETNKKSRGTITI